MGLSPLLNNPKKLVAHSHISNPNPNPSPSHDADETCPKPTVTSPTFLTPNQTLITDSIGKQKQQSLEYLLARSLVSLDLQPSKWGGQRRRSKSLINDTFLTAITAVTLQIPITPSTTAGATTVVALIMTPTTAITTTTTAATTTTTKNGALAQTLGPAKPKNLCPSDLDAIPVMETGPSPSLMRN